MRGRFRFAGLVEPGEQAVGLARAHHPYGTQRRRPSLRIPPAPRPRTHPGSTRAAPSPSTRRCARRRRRICRSRTRRRRSGGLAALVVGAKGGVGVGGCGLTTAGVWNGSGWRPHPVQRPQEPTERATQTAAQTGAPEQRRRSSPRDRRAPAPVGVTTVFSANGRWPSPASTTRRLRRSA